MPTFSFITANYVARALNYNANPNWGAHDAATLAQASPESFADLARDIASAGFDAIDLWGAHAHWTRANDTDFVEQIKGICSQFDFTITGYAAGIGPGDFDAIFRHVKQLGAPMLEGGFFGGDIHQHIDAINTAAGKYNLKYAFENHPEKSIPEILDKVKGGTLPNIGIALDTGWCGTQGIDAAEAVRTLRPHLLAVHLKDVTSPGAHETCALGDGIVDIKAVLKELKQSGYEGPLGIEHEPFDRDPTPEVITSLQRAREWIR